MGAGEDLLRSALLLDNAVTDEEHPVGYLPGEAHLVGDDENGHAAAGQLPDDVQHLLDHFRVQSGGWLVKKHDLRLHGHGPDDGQPLLLAAGELPGILIGLVPQAHPAQQGHGLLFRLILGDLLFQNRGQCHIFQHRQVGEHIEMLEHHADALAVLGDVQLFVGDVLSLEEDLAAVRGFQQVQATEKRGLAAAGGADDGHHLAPADSRGDALQHLQLAEALFQVPGFQNHVSH